MFFVYMFKPLRNLKKNIKDYFVKNKMFFEVIITTKNFKETKPKYFATKEEAVEYILNFEDRIAFTLKEFDEEIKPKFDENDESIKTHAT